MDVIKTYSIIIPVYNVKDVLERCIKSVLAQTYRHFEVILVDDGSIDGSSEICDKYSCVDKRIYVVHQANKGVSSARNKGLSLAQGDYVVFVDSDDYIEQEFLEHIYDYTNCDTDIICGGYDIETQDRKIARRSYKLECIDAAESILRAFADGKLNYVWGKAIRRSLIKNCNASFNENLNIAEDTLFMVDLLPCVKEIAYIEFSDYHYVKYHEKRLTQITSHELLLTKVEEANDLIYEHLNCIFGHDAEKYCIIRLGDFYKEYLSTKLSDKSTLLELKNLYTKKWFKKTLDYVDDFYACESVKFRWLLKTKSYHLLYYYLKFLKK